ncbi:MAG: LptF/LptG family permease [Bacteroidetes bacterium]|nr:LptF/LptG family permease [Bacteroidota bacterium]
MIKKLDLYIIRKFLGTFFYAIALIIIVVIIFDISEKIDDFIEKKAPLHDIIFNYYLNFIPYFINLFSPLFTFVAVIFFTSKMASNTEVVAILNAGVSFKRFLYPYILSAVIIGLMTFYLANFLIPNVNVHRLAFEKKYIKNNFKASKTNYHLQLEKGTYVYLEGFDNFSNNGFRFSIEKINETGLFYKLTAEQITWDSTSGKWHLLNCTIRTLDGTNEIYNRKDNMDLAMNIRPSDFTKENADVETMDYTQLRKFINQEKLRGSDRVKFYEVEKYQRISYPFATIVLTLIGVSLSSRKVRGGIGLNLAFGLAITFSFILFMKISTVFATYGNLPAYLSVWIPIILFGLMAVQLIKKAPK